jgi:hypothetical protein
LKRDESPGKKMIENSAVREVREKESRGYSM